MTAALVITLRRSDNGEVPLGPHESWVKLGVLEPPNLVVDAVGKIDSVLEWRYLILGVLGDDNVAQDKDAAWA